MTPKSTAGERLRARIQAELDENGVELDAKELALFERAQATADRIEELEAVVRETGLTTKGHRGLIVSPVVTEIRQQSLLLKSLLAGFSLTVESADAKTNRGRAAANARWDGRGGNVQARGGGPASKPDRRESTSPKRSGALPEAI